MQYHDNTNATTNHKKQQPHDHGVIDTANVIRSIDQSRIDQLNEATNFKLLSID